MNEDEIRMLYRDAKDKKQQIYILAQLSAKPLAYIASVVQDVPVKDDGRVREYKGVKYGCYQEYMDKVIADLLYIEKRKARYGGGKGKAEKGSYRKTFAQNLMKILKKREMTQSYFAKSLGLSIELISRWCRGECAPDVMYIPIMSNVLAVSLEELLLFQEANYDEC